MSGSIMPSPETLAELAEFYNRRTRRVDGMIGDRSQQLRDTGGQNEIVWPLIQDKAHRRPDPAIIGGSQIFQRAAKSLVDSSPAVKAGLYSIMVGPTSDSMRLMERSKLPREAFAGTNLGGIANRVGGRIGIQPLMGDRDQIAVLMHELAHIAGYGILDAPDKEADEAIDIYNKMQPSDYGRVERWSPSQIRRR